MFLDVITLVIIGLIVVLSFLLVWYISSTLQKNRDVDRVRQDRVVTRVEQVSRELSEVSRLIVKCQSDINKEIETFSHHINLWHSFVTTQYENFTTQAKFDMLSARREELLRTKELKVALERLMGIAMTSRQPAAPNDVLALENLTNRIQELEIILGGL